MIAKKSGAKIIPTLLINVSIFSKTFDVDRAIPTANAPTIVDRPIKPARADAPKKQAVAIASILPLAFHNLGVTTLGTIKTEAINITAKKPRT